MLLAKYLDARTEVLAQDNTSDLWTPAAKPEAVAELRAICGLQAGQSVISADNVAAAVIALMSAWDPPAPVKAPPATAAPPAKGPAPKGK